MADENKTKEESLVDDIAAFFLTKPWFLSRGVMGPVLGFAAMGLGWIGITIDEETREAVLALLDNGWVQLAAFATTVGSLIGIYGRVKASTKVTVKK